MNLVGPLIKKVNGVMDSLEQLEACRICVTCFSLKDMDFINIFLPNEEFQQELNFIQGQIRHWHLKIHPDDGLPQRMCADCFAKFCSIEAFRKECEFAQKKLLDTLIQQPASNEPELQPIIKNTEIPLPLVGNYENSSVPLDSSNNILVSSVNVTQSDISLNDFPVFDQQFSHYDNPALMDASSTLLDTNLMTPETTQELGFLPSQNLFTFDTTEPPLTGTLPLDDTGTTSIMNEMLEVKSGGDEIVKHDDLEDMLQHSIIPTTTKLLHRNSCLIVGQKINGSNTESIKLEHFKNQHNNNSAMKVDAKDYIYLECENPSMSFLNHEEANSDIECDESHINDRLKSLPYACHYCFCPETGNIDHLVFPNEDALSQHFFDVHNPNRPYSCPKCPQSFKTKILRDDHVRFVHKLIEFQNCNYCQKRLKCSTDIHQLNCQYIGNWECGLCKEKFSNTPLYRFRLHQRQHERSKNFKCHLCERSFVRKANLETHQKIHKTGTESTYTCNTCNTNFADDYKLKNHKCQKHNAEAPFNCKFCHKGFSSHVFLQRHINQFHSHKVNNNNKDASLSASSSCSLDTSSSRKHVCLNCNVSFKTLQNLQQHLLLGRDSNGNCLYSSCNKQERRKLQRQGVFPCCHCPKRFHLRSQLDKHLNTHDARLRPFQCEQCVIRCRTTSELKQHVNVAHLNIKAFSCDKCGKCFGYKKDLSDHMLFHAEINVRCNEEGCDYVCKNEKALNDHKRHKHRLLTCEYCHEQFTRQKLTAHLRKIHRDEIDIQLASETDKFYKSQLLNNNNDITQISFNLLNIQQQEQQLLNTSPQHSLTSLPSQNLATTINSSQHQTQASVISTSSSSSTSASLLTPSPIISVSTSPISSSVSSCPTSNTKATNLSSNSTSLSGHNTSIIDDVDNHENQFCSLFATDSHDPNGTTLALNNLVSNEDDLNLVVTDTTNVFLVPSTASSTNDNQLDQYFMASLIDAEQEVIVT